MREKNITLNGTVYDTATGKAIRLDRSGHSRAPSAHAVHSRTQHSRTLNRKYVKKDSAPSASAPKVVTRPPKRTTSDAVTHSAVRKFADVTPTNSTAVHTRPQSTPRMARSAPIEAVHHPLVRKLEKNHPVLSSKKTVHTPLPSHVLKQQAIDEATLSMQPRHLKKHVSQPNRPSKTRRLGFASAALAIIMLSGYFTYLYMPNLSTKVAAAQAGINAQYPAYQPSGYRLAGAVAYQPGEVSMRFAANAGPENFTLTQRQSAWDSSAVLANHIEPSAKNDYTTTRANGLTIYSYGSHSAWVNGGILYTIDGNAPLSNEQIQRIATSL